MKPYKFLHSAAEDCGFGQTFDPEVEECQIDRILLVCLVVAAVLLLVILPAAVALAVYCVTVVYKPRREEKKSRKRVSDIVTSNHKPRSIYSRRKQEINRYLKDHEQKTNRQEKAKKMPVRQCTFVRASSKSSNDSDLQDM
ncbi:unnamed protein product [Bursaphelenchus xylophilus]|uniref:(pine wood nematode) hypothetical protein n=1 Tax=Bursaphelenchus xylophilus TaxID=6326 RepID=A0A1I7RNG6_BURXY|nr:unnamed protein product [Bursaphelenchus xylophilus]CAG9123993.1 unnamed protein product [Bursaphelenchus xylophilus]